MVWVEHPSGSTTLQNFLEFLEDLRVRHVPLHKLVHNRGTHCSACPDLPPGSVKQAERLSTVFEDRQFESEKRELW